MTKTHRTNRGLASLAALALLGAGLGVGFVPGTARAADLPPLPQAIKDKGVLQAGVKCDYPPDGFLDNSGKPVGIEVGLAAKIAEYAFGSADKVDYMCVTSANRVPSLVGGKVDLLVATMGISPERAEVIDFSEPYTWSASSVLVAEDSAIQKLEDLKGKTVVVLKGAWQIGWFEKNLPEAELMKLDTVSDALQSLLQGRADAYAHDWAAQLGLAKNNDRVRMLDELYKIGYRGAGVRKGEAEWLAFVNAALAQARADGTVEKLIREYEQPDLVEARLKLWDPSQAPKDAAQ